MYNQELWDYMVKSYPWDKPTEDFFTTLDKLTGQPVSTNKKDYPPYRLICFAYRGEDCGIMSATTSMDMLDRIEETSDIFMREVEK